jgi:hypothetical protein
VEEPRALVLDDPIQDAQRGERGLIMTGKIEHIEAYQAQFITTLGVTHANS